MNKTVVYISLFVLLVFLATNQSTLRFLGSIYAPAEGYNGASSLLTPTYPSPGCTQADSLVGLRIMQGAMFDFDINEIDVDSDADGKLEKYTKNGAAVQSLWCNCNKYDNTYTYDEQLESLYDYSLPNMEKGTNEIKVCITKLKNEQPITSSDKCYVTTLTATGDHASREFTGQDIEYKLFTNNICVGGDIVKKDCTNNMNLETLYQCQEGCFNSNDDSGNPIVRCGENCVPGGQACNNEQELLKCEQTGVIYDITSTIAQQGYRCDAAQNEFVCSQYNKPACIDGDVKICPFGSDTWQLQQDCTNGCENAACTKLCEPNEILCENGKLYQCSANGLSKTFYSNCGEAGCTNVNNANDICTQVCTPSAYFCSGADLGLCSADGLSYTTTECPGKNNGWICENGACQKACTPGEHSCRDGDDYVCTDGYNYVLSQTCNDDLGCDVSTGNCNRCTPDTERCVNAIEYTCDALDLYKINTKPCGTYGCEGDKCANACEAGTLKCKQHAGDSDWFSEECSASGDAIIGSTRCDSNLGCNMDTGACYSCTNINEGCLGTQLRVCNGANLNIINCPFGCSADNMNCYTCDPTEVTCLGNAIGKCNGYTLEPLTPTCDIGCREGACLVCNPTAGPNCNGNQLQKCKTDGMGYDTLDSCGYTCDQTKLECKDLIINLAATRYSFINNNVKIPLTFMYEDIAMPDNANGIVTAQLKKASTNELVSESSTSIKSGVASLNFNLIGALPAHKLVTNIEFTNALGTLETVTKEYAIDIVQDVSVELETKLALYTTEDGKLRITIKNKDGSKVTTAPKIEVKINDVVISGIQTVPAGSSFDIVIPKTQLKPGILKLIVTPVISGVELTSSEFKIDVVQSRLKLVPDADINKVFSKGKEVSFSMEILNSKNERVKPDVLLATTSIGETVKATEISTGRYILLTTANTESDNFNIDITVTKADYEDLKQSYIISLTGSTTQNPTTTVTPESFWKPVYTLLIGIGLVIFTIWMIVKATRKRRRR